MVYLSYSKTNQTKQNLNPVFIAPVPHKRNPKIESEFRPTKNMFSKEAERASDHKQLNRPITPTMLSLNLNKIGPEIYNTPTILSLNLNKIRPEIYNLSA